MQSGEKTEDEIFVQFLAHFGDTRKDGNITKSEWNDYYAAVSASIESDEHFVWLVRTSWRLD